MADDILVPIGGTEESVIALPTALALARSLGTGVHLVHVVDGPSGPLSRTAAALGASPAVAAVRARTDRTLTRLAQKLSGEGLRATAAVLDGGDVPGLLTAEARERRARMIVIAARPRTAIERAVFGNVADRLIGEAELPVVVVPVRNSPEQRALVHDTELGSDLAPAALRAARPVRRILVPIDGSPHALRALNALQPAARAADEVVLLHVVVQTTLQRVALPIGVLEREARDRLEDLAARLRRAVPSIRAEVVTRNDPAAAITAAAEDGGADLVAMSTRGESGLRQAVLGSTVADVLRSASTPVLVVAVR